MGQCGCADTAPDFKLPGPDGITYGIQIYPSCHYCDTPAGVEIYRFDDEFAVEWLDGVEDAPLIPYGNDTINAQVAIPVLDPEHLVTALAEHFVEDSDLDESDVREIAEQDARYALPEAVRKTREEWERMRREADQHRRAEP